MFALWKLRTNDARSWMLGVERAFATLRHQGIKALIHLDMIACTLERPIYLTCTVCDLAPRTMKLQNLTIDS